MSRIKNFSRTTRRTALRSQPTSLRWDRHNDMDLVDEDEIQELAPPRRIKTRPLSEMDRAVKWQEEADDAAWQETYDGWGKKMNRRERRYDRGAATRRFAADDTDDKPTKKTKKNEKKTREPGHISSGLRRRMGDALADIFDEFGPQIYANVVTKLKGDIVDEVSAGFDKLDAKISEELGQRGMRESREHIGTWADEFVADVNHAALEEVGGALNDFIGTLTAEFMQEDADDEDVDLLDVPDDIETVEEEDVVPLDEDTEGDTDEDTEKPVPAVDESELIDLGDVGIGDLGEEAAAAFGPTGGRRKRPVRRPVRRQARRHFTAGVVEDLTNYVEAELEDKMRRAIEAASHPRDAAHKLKGVVINAAKQLSDDWQQMFPPAAITEAAEKLLADHT